jgi:uncharacterized protein involved in outer membrane biogenesis
MKKVLVCVCIGVLALIIIAALAIHFFLDSAIKSGVETVGSKMTKVDVKLDGVHLSLISGSGRITGLVIGNPDGYKTPNAISVGTAALALKPGSLLADKLVISSIDVESPEITFEGGLSHDNLKQIRDNLNETTSSSGPSGSNTVAGATPKEEKKANKKLEVDNFQITNAKLDVSITGVVEKTLTLPTIQLTGLGTGPDGITAAELTKKVIAAIEEAATKEVASNAGDLTKDISNLTKGLGINRGSLTNATKGLGDLFKKQ